MMKKILTLALVLGVLGLSFGAPDVHAKRRCPPGTDDNGTDVCTPKR